MAGARQVEETPLESCLNTPGLAESELLPHFDVRSLIQLTRTNRNIHGLFAVREALLDALIAHSAHTIVNEPTENNIAELKKTLGIYPEILKRKIKKTVVQHTDQAYIKYSLMQLAFAEGDSEMCYVLKHCFESAFGAEAARDEIRKQLDEKFAQGNEEEKKQHEARDLEIKKHLAELLAAVIWVFSNKKLFDLHRWDDKTRLILEDAAIEAITAFRGAFAASQPKTISEGMRFPYETLLEAYRAYNAAAWDCPYKRFLFEDGILSTLLSYIPKNDAQNISFGLYHLLAEEYKLDSFSRSLATKPDGRDFYDVIHGPSAIFRLHGAHVDVLSGSQRREDIILPGIAGEIMSYHHYAKQKMLVLRNLLSIGLSEKEIFLPHNNYNGKNR